MRGSLKAFLRYMQDMAGLLAFVAVVAAVLAISAVIASEADAKREAWRNVGTQVSAYRAILDPTAARIVQPDKRWYPPACRGGGHGYSDISAYRRNGRALGPQEDMGRHSYFWESAPTYGVAYNRAPRTGRPYFTNMARGPILAAVWCEKWGPRAHGS